MATFCVTFLIAASTKIDEIDVGGSNVKHKIKHEQRHRESKKEDKTNDVYDIGRPLAVCHIEYNITIEHKYEIDVISWDNAAKVYTNFGEKCIKVYQKNNVSWIVFSVYHRMNLQDKQLEELHKTQIHFRWSFDKNKLGKKAANEKVKTFYIFLDPNDNEYYPFLELYQSPSKSVSDSKGNQKPFDYDAASSLLSALPYRQHWNEIMKIIDRATNEILSMKKDEDEKIRGSTIKEGLRGKDVLVDKTQSKQKGIKHDKSKRGIKRDIKEHGVNASIKGEFVFTGNEENVMVGVTEKDFPVLKVSAILSVLNLMTDNQRMKYNPLIVTANKLCNLPVTYIRDHGITSVFLVYTFLDESITSPMLQIDKIMHYNDSHVIFTHKYPISKLLEYFQTGSLTIDIFGTCNIENENNKDDQTHEQDECRSNIGNALKFCPTASFHNRNLENLANKSVYLARCKCPLYRLYFGVSILKLTCPLYIPNSLAECIELPKLDGGIVSTNETNASTYKHLTNESLISNFKLLELGSSLDVVLKLVIPMKYSLRLVSESQQFYNRILCVMNNLEIGTDIIKTVMSFNKLYLKKEVVPKPRVFIRETSNSKNKSSIFTEVSDLHPWGNSLIKFNEESKKHLRIQKSCLTGFVIVSIEEMLIYVEGAKGGKLKDIWNRVNKLSRNTGKVFYNSELCFESRLYGDFITYGGLYKVTLKDSWDDLLSRSQILIKGFVPELCSRALVKLDLLKKSRSMKSASWHNLFPLSEELVSLDTEFGLPPSTSDFC